MQKKTIAGLIALVTIVAAVIFAGCVEESPSTPTVAPTLTPPTELSLGDSVIINNISFAVVEYEFADSFIDDSNRTQSSKEGAKFLLLYVKATNIGDVAQYIPENHDVSILYKGTEITHYKVYWYYYLKSEKRELYAYTLIGGFEKIYPDVTEEGWILFEVPEGINLSQAKIRVDSPTNHTKTVTWIF